MQAIPGCSAFTASSPAEASRLALKDPIERPENASHKRQMAYLFI
jgi:hypothetical protein